MPKLTLILSIAGPLVAIVFTGISITVSPWFNFYNNALSDLGNSLLHRSTSWIFNSGLVVSGILIALYALLATFENRDWKYLCWTTPLTAAGVDLALVGFFPENVGRIHNLVSVFLFSLMIIAMLAYSYVSWPLKRPRTGAVALLFSIASIFLWFNKWPWKGVAIQETVSSVLAVVWLVLATRQSD